MSYFILSFQKYVRQWIQYHNIQNTHVSKYKRLQLQLKLETWRNEALQIKERNMTLHCSDDCMLNFSLEKYPIMKISRKTRNQI